MRSPIVFCCVIAPILLLSACSRGADSAGEQGPAKQQLNALADDLRAGRVGTVEVLRIPDNVLFEIRVAPETIEQVWNFRFTIHKREGSGIEKTEMALKGARAWRVSDASDLRWAVILQSSVSGDRLGAIYFDRTGRRGAVGNIPVAFGSGFFANLKTALSPRLD
jgi:hypothetical protein